MEVISHIHRTATFWVTVCSRCWFYRSMIQFSTLKLQRTVFYGWSSSEYKLFVLLLSSCFLFVDSPATLRSYLLRRLKASVTKQHVLCVVSVVHHCAILCFVVFGDKTGVLTLEHDSNFILKRRKDLLLLGLQKIHMDPYDLSSVSFESKIRFSASRNLSLMRSKCFKQPKTEDQRDVCSIKPPDFSVKLYSRLTDSQKKPRKKNANEARPSETKRTMGKYLPIIEHGSPEKKNAPKFITSHRPPDALESELMFVKTGKYPSGCYRNPKPHDFRPVSVYQLLELKTLIKQKDWKTVYQCLHIILFQLAARWRCTQRHKPELQTLLSLMKTFQNFQLHMREILAT